MTKSVDTKLVDRLQRLKGLTWISDAPLFIDRTLVERFFDAIVRPAYEHESITEGSETAKSFNLKAAAEIEAKAELAKPTWIPDWLFPLKGELTAKGGVEGTGGLSKTTSRLTQLKPIWNAERQLEELTRHYFQFHPTRLVIGEKPFDDEDYPGDWSIFNAGSEFFTDVPRALAFVDLPAGTKIIPTAAEFEDGTVSLLYKDFTGKLTTEEGGPKRNYPDEVKITETEFKQKSLEYWASFVEPFKSTTAMVVIEEASQLHNRIRWIDFQILIGAHGQTLHLHVVPAGHTDAGVFGYNFVRRAFKHGVRLVGTLKSSPDMNVLAIYEK